MNCEWTLINANFWGTGVTLILASTNCYSFIVQLLIEFFCHPEVVECVQYCRYAALITIYRECFEGLIKDFCMTILKELELHTDTAILNKNQ